jgi:GNAT superfamily N-acetyltransferase
MWPLVWSGARLSIEACALDDLTVGDLAAVRSELGVVVHRVVNHAGVLGTRGDWNTLPDAPITPERLVGRVRGFAVGRWTLPTPRWLTSRLNRAALALHPVVRRAQERNVIAQLRNGRDLLARTPVGSLVRGRAGVEVRVLGSGDAAALRRGAWARGRYASAIHHELSADVKSRSVLGALQRGRLVGQIVVRADEDEPTVATAWDFWVDPWFRGRGIGRRLAQLAMREAEARGYSELRALVRAASRSHELFVGLGFEALRETQPGLLLLHRVCARSAAR